ncbi:MAG: hypothetical protein ACRAUR_14795, partial [Acinetobacter tandoii]
RTVRYQKSNNSFHLLIDTTVLEYLNEEGYKPKKHQSEYCCQWSELYICIDAEIFQIYKLQLTTNNVSSIHKYSVI